MDAYSYRLEYAIIAHTEHIATYAAVILKMHFTTNADREQALQRVVRAYNQLREVVATIRC